jgi:HAD superfamily hydrolase (TIGR01509 family)
MRNLQHFIWDFDGTLFDTYPGIIGVLQKALGQFGHSCEPAEAMKLMLETIPITRDFYADKYGIDKDALKDAYMHYHKAFVEGLESVPMAATREVLEAICASGRHNYIFTHRKHDETMDFLRKYDLTHYFRDIICPEHPNFAWKPAPDAVDYLMKTYDMDPAQTAMIGDRERDLGSGRNAGIKTVHLICPLAPETLECDYRLNDLGDMLKML